MVLKNDLMVFEVIFKNSEDDLVRISHETFAEAAGHAEGLSGVTRMINVKFFSADGLSSISGTLHIYNGVTNQRRICNEYLVKQVLKHEQKAA